MNDSLTIAKQLVVGAFLGIVSLLHPWAATGAAFGCLFYLAMPNPLNMGRKFLMTLVSWSVGYGAGVFSYGEGPPWTQKAMVVSILASALAAVVLTSIHSFIQSGSALPPWLSAILDKIPFGNRRGDT